MISKKTCLLITLIVITGIVIAGITVSINNEFNELEVRLDSLRKKIHGLTPDGGRWLINPLQTSISRITS